MVGRGALGRPWIFSESFDALSPEGKRDYKIAVIARHCALIREQFREKYALVQMQKHLAWYTEGLGHATDCRRRLFECRTHEDVWAVFTSYWDRHWEEATPADRANAAVIEPVQA